ncbi:glycosyltransferase auxiliary protein/glycosyltransferase auxiliary protein/glycosyltransferase auxiliary protein DesVIII [Allonocardiopsis opalescens]|uniref:Glycosyltransferase auxiliary protein/glycosyltransferase auxiliary protein/glycosyltransferase auxiliary protein DesVIII n=2 Tax=Allonocardiopsis opalescens TaxID=1144618 RepID=A0A2T0QCR8_9ACTN|nr:glycosyltransferase auxiliary protein/glycosyltransferase auxiliary protein/glycosyltransferase auxiliary protein DesVIII [Allonocardiopsis opalescens]
MRLGPLDRPIAEATDTELGMHLLNARGVQWVMGSFGEPYARILRGQADDPYPFYEPLRHVGPLMPSATGAFVTAEEAVAAAVVDGPGFGTATADGAPAPPQLLPFFDGLPGLGRADVDRLRPVWEPAFGPGAAADHRAAAERLHAAALDAVGDPDGGFELMAGFAWPAAASVTAELLGLPESARPAFADCCRRLAVLPDAMLAGQQITRVRELDAAMAELDGLLAALPAPADGDPRAVRTVRTLVSALGTALAANLIGNAVLALLGEAKQWEALVDAPDLAAAAVEETLRYDPPVQIEARVAREATELGGMPVPAGGQVAAVVAAVGRDARVHADPDRFDLERPDAARHLALRGLHYELLARLVRLQAEVALRTLAARLPGLRLDGPPLYRRRAPVTRGPLELPAAARP